jgi:hypothetical protein
LDPAADLAGHALRQQGTGSQVGRRSGSLLGCLTARDQVDNIGRGQRRVGNVVGLQLVQRADEVHAQVVLIDGRR